MNLSEPWPPFRVLCVDDNRDCADSSALLFETLGFDARAAYDGPAALALNESFRPAVCLLDLNLPGMTGDELAKQLRAGLGWRPLLLVAVTAMSDEKARIRIEAAQFDLHLVKPVDPQKLVGLVDSLFRAASVRQHPLREYGPVRKEPTE
jgi:CheY-like chemotaxis protein